MNETLATPIAERTFKMLPARADVIEHGEIVLPSLYDQMKKEGTFEMFFHDFPDLTFGQFVKTLSEPGEYVHAVCVYENDAIVDVAAIAMMTDIRYTDIVKRGLGNFLLFKKYWDSDQSTKIAALILDGWFAQLNTVVGVTPETNERALRFIQHMGFKTIGALPGFASYRGALCASVASYQTKSMWLERRETLLGV